MRPTSARGRFADPIDDEPLADINVTPFVDVVLVLLIIFMITAAVVEFGMQVSVPPTTTVKAQPQRSSNTISISSEGEIVLDGRVISIYDVVPLAKKANPEEPSVYLRVNRVAPYKFVAQVLAECGAAGVKINLVPRPLPRDPRIRRR